MPLLKRICYQPVYFQPRHDVYLCDRCFCLEVTPSRWTRWYAWITGRWIICAFCRFEIEHGRW